MSIKKLGVGLLSGALCFSSICPMSSSAAPTSSTVLNTVNVPGLAASQCVATDAAKTLISTGSACAAGGGVTSTTSANSLLTASPTTGAVVLTANETPIFTGNVTSNTGLQDGGFAGTNGCVGATNAGPANLLAVNTNCVASLVAGTGITITTPGSNPTVNVTNPVTATAPSLQKFTSGSGTYTTPAGVKWIKTLAVGAGGGGGGSNGGGTGGTGGATTFGTSLITSNGGVGGATATAYGGLGGVATLAAGPLGSATNGGDGSPTFASGGGGQGGSSCLGGAGSGTGNALVTAALAGKTNSGGGGGGSNGATGSGNGGGAGACINVIIDAPLATYAFAVGAAGTAGTAGAGGTIGGAGGSGFIMVEEHYNY